MDENRPEIHEIICVVSKFTTKEALAVCHELEATYPGVSWTRQQEKPYLGGALNQTLSRGPRAPHTFCCGKSDLETPPL